MDHRQIEELSLNNWPALSTLLYDGWVLRFAEGFTKRANSINPIHDSTWDVDGKIEQCERIYAANQLPEVYKITPFVRPGNLDGVLANRVYSVVDITSVQTLRLDSLAEPKPYTVQIDELATDAWIGLFCRMNRMDLRYKPVMERMLSNIRTPKGFITLFSDGEAVSCGLGVIERGYIGLYDIVTDERYRNRGFAEQMILHLLHWGKANGAGYSYLAVVAENAPALRLYSKLGYSEIYKYWYRVKNRLSRMSGFMRRPS